MATRKEIEAAIEQHAASRIAELDVNPIKGNFDKEHLLKIHGYIFQDAPKIDAEYSKEFVRPGEVREIPVGGMWEKNRVLEGAETGYSVFYARRKLETSLDEVLNKTGGAEGLRGTKSQAAEKLSQLYGDLDYLHPFREGNSRTLRTFTSQMAKEAGFDLDWKTTNVDAINRNELYIARDREVISRDVFGVDLQTAMKDSPNDVKHLVYAGSKDSKTLKDIIQDSMTPIKQLSQDAKQDKQLEIIKKKVQENPNLNEQQKQFVMKQVQEKLSKTTEQEQKTKQGKSPDRGLDR